MFTMKKETTLVIDVSNQVLMNEINTLLRLTKLTQAQLAEKVGVAPARISEYMKGKRNITLNRLKQWCSILDIDIKRLL